MFASWKSDKVKALYEAVQNALLTGASTGKIIQWSAGDTSVEKSHDFALTPQNIAAINEEYGRRFGFARPRYRRAQMRFAD